MRVLLVSYHFPPFNSVGAVRPGKFAKFLYEQGHTVHVLTCSNPSVVKGIQLEIPSENVHSVPAWSINAPVQWLLGGRGRIAKSGYMPVGIGRGWLRVLGRLYKTLLHWPDAEAGWINASKEKGLNLFAEQKFDLIYVSAPSFSGLIVGASLSRETGIPWVAEFRDLWSDNHNYELPFWRRWIDRIWERQVLKSAAALVTISEPLAAKLKRHAKPVWVVRNGFDPDDLIEIKKFLWPKDTLNIVYTGSVYPDHHDVNGFFAGLSLFKQEGGVAKVRVVGRNVAPFIDAAKRWNVTDFVKVEATVERQVALSMQCSADVLLFFIWQGGDKGIYTTKLFEYAGAQRPILVIGEELSDVSDMLRGAGIGYVASRARSVADHLHAWTLSKKNEGPIHFQKSIGYDFSRRSQFIKLKSLMQGLLAR